MSFKDKIRASTEKRKIEYVIATGWGDMMRGISPTKPLVKLVGKLLAEGWKLQGGVSLGGGHGDFAKASQALTRTVRRTNKKPRA